MSSPIPVTLVGATGLTGKSTLLSLFSSSIPFSITTFARRSIPLTTPTNPQIKWEQKERPDLFSVVNEKVGEKMGVFVSCLGTTIAQAGGMEKQKKIDLDLNRDLAKKAKEDGVSTYILVSSTGSDSSSWFHYTKMKGQLEDAVKEIGFDHCIILRPALLLGDRGYTRKTEFLVTKTIRAYLSLGGPGSSMLAIDSDDVGACIAHLAANPPTEKVITLSNSEMIQIAAKHRAATASS